MTCAGLALLALASSGCSGANETELFGTPPAPTVDAGSDAKPDARKDADTPDVAPPTPLIACGPPLGSPQYYCDANKKELCCRKGPQEPFTYLCTNEAQCGDPGDLPITCSSTKTCTALGNPGNVCCGTLFGNGSGSVMTQTACVAASSCVSGGSVGKTILCDPGAPNNCPNGGTCKLSSQTMPGYYLCI